MPLDDVQSKIPGDNCLTLGRVLVDKAVEVAGGAIPKAKIEQSSAIGVEKYMLGNLNLLSVRTR